MLREKIYIWRSIFALFMLLVSGELLAQRRVDSVKIYFAQGDDVVVESYNLGDLSLLVDSLREQITHISIAGYSSPEGGVRRNLQLSQLRGEAVRDYLVLTKGLPDSLISISAEGVAWSRMQRIVEGQRQNYAGQVLQILESSPVAQRTAKLQSLEGGALYWTLLDNIYPLLRYSDVALYSFRPQPLMPAPALKVVEVQREIEAEIDAEVEADAIALTPLFAIKTNLLYDAATLINVAVEIPIARRWSIAAEYIFPWWVFDNGREDSARNRIQLLCGNLEARRWWGDRASQTLLTGWFTGLYAGVGSYDFEYDAEGYQGEFFLSAGLTVGYAHTINRAETLRLEYSLGVGYMATDYRHYHAEYCVNEVWHAIEQNSGRYSWAGATGVGVSLSWLINAKAKR
ncbi:MAG: DUF3575 domain-containing protein [Rikenellaceae bacterium]